MSCRFTGMRHLRPRQDLITKTENMIKVGLLEEPGWLKVLKRSPPPPLQLKSKRRIPNIILPTDRLYKTRTRNHPPTEPFFAHGGIQSAGLLFANRQWELMKTKNMSEKDAYRMVEEQLKNMKVEALDQMKGLASSLGKEGASTALLSDPSAAEQFSEWQKRLEETPWEDWELGQQVMLDHWICKTVLEWDWEKERYLKDATFEAELTKLRETLFLTISHSNDDQDGTAVDDDLDEVDEEDHELEDEDAINAWYAAYGAWQTKAYNQPDLSKWADTEKNELDRWILENVLSSAISSTTIDPLEVLDLLEDARNRLFPPLRSNHRDDATDGPIEAPDVDEVKEMIAAIPQPRKLSKSQLKRLNEWERNDRAAIRQALEDEKWNKRELAREKILLAQRRAKAVEDQRALEDWIKNEL